MQFSLSHTHTHSDGRTFQGKVKKVRESGRREFFSTYVVGFSFYFFFYVQARTEKNFHFASCFVIENIYIHTYVVEKVFAFFYAFESFPNGSFVEFCALKSPHDGSDRNHVAHVLLRVFLLTLRYFCDSLCSRLMLGALVVSMQTSSQSMVMSAGISR